MPLRLWQLGRKDALIVSSTHHLLELEAYIKETSPATGEAISTFKVVRSGLVRAKPLQTFIGMPAKNPHVLLHKLTS
jgi:hypothetical protein